MGKKIFKGKRNLQELIEKIELEMQVTDPGSERYAALNKQLECLTKSFDNLSGLRKTVLQAIPAMIQSGVSLTQIFMILRHEDKGNIIPKEINYAQKPR